MEQLQQALDNQQWERADQIYEELKRSAMEELAWIPDRSVVVTNGLLAIRATVSEDRETVFITYRWHDGSHLFIVLDERGAEKLVEQINRYITQRRIGNG